MSKRFQPSGIVTFAFEARAHALEAVDELLRAHVVGEEVRARRDGRRDEARVDREPRARADEARAIELVDDRGERLVALERDLDVLAVPGPELAG